MSIQRFFHNIGAFFGRIFGADQAKKIQDLLVNTLVPIAIGAVTSVEELTGLKGSAKQDAAAKIIYDQLGTAGKSIGRSLINLAIETALAKIQGVFGN